MKEKLIELLCKAHSMATEASAFDDATYAQQLEMEADFLIANGVTIPVRCKDCTHRHTRYMCQGRQMDYFCANGERK